MNQEEILKNIRQIEIQAGKLRYDALPSLFFIIGLLSGIVFSLASNVLHDLWGDILLYKIIVLLLTVLIVIWFILDVRKRYLLPIANMEKISDELVKELKAKLLNPIDSSKKETP